MNVSGTEPRKDLVYQVYHAAKEEHERERERDIYIYINSLISVFVLMYIE